MNLSTEFNFDIKHFFSWWARGLIYWLPEKIKPLFSQRFNVVFITVMDGTLQFKQQYQGEEQLIAQLDLTVATIENYQQLIDTHQALQKAQFILRLQTPQALKKVLYLPSAAKENLQQVIAFEMDKYTPFKVEQVYFAVKILEKELNGQIKVLLVVTPKEILDPVYQQLKGLEIYPEYADYEPVKNNYSDDFSPYNLLPKWDAPVKNKVTHLLAWFLSSCLVILLLAIFLLPIWQSSQTVESLSSELKQLTKAAHWVQNQQLEADELIDETVNLIKVKQESPSMIELINTLSQLLPIDTWLTHFKYNNGKCQIQGQSPAASTLIGLLEASPLFNNARFVSPLTQDKKTGKERFQISVDILAPVGDNND